MKKTKHPGPLCDEPDGIKTKRQRMIRAMPNSDNALIQPIFPIGIQLRPCASSLIAQRSIPERVIDVAKTSVPKHSCTYNSLQAIIRIVWAKDNKELDFASILE